MASVDTAVARPYLYAIGEVGESTPVKIGWSGMAPASRLGQHQLGNWRPLEYLYLEHIPAPHVVAREFSVHLGLDAHWRTGEWFDVRHLAAAHRNGWAGVIADAAGEGLPGPLRSSDGQHALVDMEKSERGFVVTCSCGERVVHRGRLPKAVLRFATQHLGTEWVRPVMRHRCKTSDQFT